jgi:phospholipid/cholesterol/gamma-HCH transport system ATP-binding protein
LKEGMESDDPILRHFFNRQCPKETNTEGLYHFEFID